MILFHNTVNADNSYNYLYLKYLIDLFYWQHKYFWIYYSTLDLITEKLYLYKMSFIILLTSEYSAVDELWYHYIVSYFNIKNIYILSFLNQSSHSFLTNSLDSLSDVTVISATILIMKLSFIICIIKYNDCVEINDLLLNWLNINVTVSFLFFIRLVFLFSVSAQSLFFSEIYIILNLYCFSNSDYYICYLLSFFVIINWSRFL